MNHLILGIFVIVEPYLDLTVNQRGVSRIRFLRQLGSYQRTVHDALATVRSMTHSEDIKQLFVEVSTKQLVESVLAMSHEYITKILQQKRVHRDAFIEYSNKIKPSIEAGMRIATE